VGPQAPRNCAARTVTDHFAEILYRAVAARRPLPPVLRPGECRSGSRRPQEPEIARRAGDDIRHAVDQCRRFDRVAAACHSRRARSADPRCRCLVRCRQPGTERRCSRPATAQSTILFPRNVKSMPMQYPAIASSASAAATRSVPASDHDCKFDLVVRATIGKTPAPSRPPRPLIEVADFRNRSGAAAVEPLSAGGPSPW